MSESILFETKKLKVFENKDCMFGMSEYPDKFFDLAIVDPPYFDGPQRVGYYKGTKQITKSLEYKDLSKSWEIPNVTYFKELKRVSKNQIIWGINYFNIAMPGGRIVWLKGEGSSPFSMADIAYQSFYNRIDVFKYIWAGFWQQPGVKKEKRIHPTQKPVALYKWILNKYSKPGFKILDTHVGSGSSLIACEEFALDYVGFELDPDYFAAAKNRIDDFLLQQNLFEIKQGELNV